jgi:hypothetical protein
MNFVCLNGHTLSAFDRFGNPVDLAGHLCPVCLGKMKGYGGVTRPVSSPYCDRRLLVAADRV